MDDRFPVMVAGSGDLGAYLSANKQAIDAERAAHGAVLFRGFDVSDAQEFDKAVKAYGEENFPYKDSLSNAVRVNVTERVFTANEAPPETSIYLHHEMAQTPVYPAMLFFYCEVAPDEGGATPICRSDWVLDAMEAKNPGQVEEFASKGVRYTNVMPGADDAGSGQGRSWRSTLSSETRDGAEARLATLGYDWEWCAEDSLRVTTPVLPAIRDVGGGRRSFFNQLIAAFRGWSDSRNDPAKSITFGDGTPISVEQMADVIAIADELSFDIAWHAGDVALVDNYLVMHGRRPFRGKRRVLASLVS
ncbi:TauD/TfdA family dioxygenase [Parerythrobacter jejuensis]|uniref:SyrP protein n=1 Tax=Parerythrobacter jejuensis TaxID=795812 RepID=A0A845AML0_9SPHN|nr:TauD/TfdA family dioxygenase [Parerythrobacter jejuensis]MXP32032.1 SyrP protein [Parerythrobacter jejuensis]